MSGLLQKATTSNLHQQDPEVKMHHSALEKYDLSMSNLFIQDTYLEFLTVMKSNMFNSKLQETKGKQV